MYELHVHREGELVDTIAVESRAELDELLAHWSQLEGYTCLFEEIAAPEDLDASLDE